jgi:mRNA interferase RelE/StbE
MHKYTAVLSKKAQKKLDKLSDIIAEPIFQTILSLEVNPKPKGCKKLKGRDGFRVRVGNYRILYDVYDEILIVDIIDLGHRKDIYR